MFVEFMWLKWCVVVVGIYGKIIMILMIVFLFDVVCMDLIVINGGIINVYGLNVCMGEGEWMVVEVDEFDGIFLKLLVMVVICINLDLEYFEYYGLFDVLKEVF